MSDDDQPNTLFSDLDAAFERPEPASIDRTSIATVVASIRSSVIPAMHARSVRLVDALQSFNARSATPYGQAQQRLDFERVQTELLGVLVGQIEEVSDHLSVADANELADICEGLLAGATDRSAVECVRMLIRGKVAAGKISNSAGRLIIAVVDAEFDLEKQITAAAHEIGLEVVDGETPHPAALERVSAISDFHRDLSSAVVQVEHVGAQVSDEGIDEAIRLVNAAVENGSYAPALAAIRAVIGRASSL